MPYDSTTGIYTYDGTEAASPYKTMLNLLANSVRTAIGNLAASFSDTQQGAAQWAYNAFFDVWQRGTGDFTATGWTADRWNMISRVATTVRRVTFPATDTFFKTAYGYQIQATAATNSSKHVQAFPSEDVALMRGRTVVFEVPAQALTSATTQLTIAIEKSTTANVTTSGTWNVVNSTTATVTQAGTKVLVTTTIPADATAAGVRISISTNNVPNSGGVNISAVTFKPGSTGPTEPQRRARTPEGELPSCQKFFHLAGNGAPGIMNNPTTARFSIRYPVAMRGIPSAKLSMTAFALNPTINEAQQSSVAVGTTLGVGSGGSGTIYSVSKIEITGWSSGADGRPMTLLGDCIAFEAELP